MRLDFRAIVTVFLLMPQGVLAQELPSPGWTQEADESALHQLTQWRCPSRLGDFQRKDTARNDKLGLDVSCSYASGRMTILLHLAAADDPLDVSFERLKRRFARAGAPARDDASLTAPSPDWLAATYRSRTSGLQSGLLMRGWSGWTMDIRADYAAEDLATVGAALKDFANLIDTTAGTHLAACAASPSPPRSGNAVNMENAARKLAWGLEAGTEIRTLLLNPKQLAALQWCVERDRETEGKSFIYWRNIATPPANGVVDRLVSPHATLLVVRLSSGRSIVPDPAGLRQENNYALINDQPDSYDVLGYYAGRPSALTILDHTDMQLLVRVNKSDGKSAIYGVTGQGALDSPSGR